MFFITLLVTMLSYIVQLHYCARLMRTELMIISHAITSARKKDINKGTVLNPNYVTGRYK